MSRPLRPGDPRRLGGYEVLGRLGEGGMGTVFLGQDAQGHQVAIKVVRAEFATEDEYRRRFRSEVNRAKQVPPFSTAEVLGADPDHDPPYLVVEYVDGPSLATVVRDKGPMTGAALQSVAVGIATALTAIHGAGVIHRDLKPGNVLFALGGVKVIDFGIAQPLELTSQHTATNHMVGTVAYMAPERFEPDARTIVGFPADIFAWGAVVMYAATGRTPFAGESAPATAMRILTQPPDLTGLDGPLRDLVARALAKRAADRPTARELLDALLAVQTPPAPTGTQTPPAPTGTPPAAGQPSRPARNRRRVLISVTAVLAALGIGAAIILATAHRGDSPTASSSASPAPVAMPSKGTILAGTRHTLLHMSEIDRDLELPLDGEAVASDGTGQEAFFTLVPSGVDYLIKSVLPGPDNAERCLGVRLDPDGPGELVATTCAVSKATLFQIDKAGGKDDKGRATYFIASGSYGVVQWDETERKVYVEELGDGEPGLSFSFVDRGPV
ncbi:serine/threonine-protein kinase [Actinoplanes sp. TFC3]|uniref:serine/threonine protein kinase n=1 Tax=Actinoplanes sp. TFC3 TaxID=1710355 RepID=UPI0008351591|nr:serine/threonine-protein kinase [Actinoplanes sp. TFC3]